MAVLNHVWHTWDKDNSEPFMIPSVCSATTYIPRSTIGSWSDYFQASHGSENLPVCTIPGDHGAINTGQQILARRRDINLASEAGSTIMTILGALEYTVPDLATRSALVIHIVAAADDELSVMELNEDLLHHCPNLKELSIAYVGPHVPKTSIEKRKPCDECHKNSRSLAVAHFQALYHKCALTQKNSENVADLICAFNSGHTVDNPAVGVAPTTWTPTPKHIFASSTPAVFTTYIVMEASKEEGALDRLGTNSILRPQINPWHSLVGNPALIQPKGSMRYKNYYWYIVQGV